MENSSRQVICSIPRNPDEQIQVALTEYNGKSYVDFRIWFQHETSKELLPTKKGIVVPADKLDELYKAIEKTIGLTKGSPGEVSAVATAGAKKAH